MAGKQAVMVCTLMITAAGIAMAAPVGVTLREHLGVDWKSELVHYRIELPPGQVYQPDAVHVSPAGEDGGPALPSQLTDIERHPDGSMAACKVWFRTDLPAGATVSYTLTPGRQAASHAGVEALDDGRTITLRAPTPSGAVGIRLPSASTVYDWPKPAAEVPGPVQALLLPSGREAGRGRFEVPFDVKSYHAEITAAGPLIAEARVHYVFDVGYWTFTARVEEGNPAILISEEFNTGYSGQQMPGSMLRHRTGWDRVDRFYSLVLSDAASEFQPTQVFYGANNADPAYMDLLPRTLPSNLDFRWMIAPVHGFRLNRGRSADLFYLSGYSSVIARVGRLARTVEPGGDAIGFVGLHSDRWHNPMSLHLRTTDAHELVMSLPLQTYEQDWSSDGFGRFSPNYTGQMLFAPDLTARRHYGIVLTRAEDESEALLGSLFAAGASAALSLDEVKDWVLDWPDPMADAAWAESTSERGQAALDLLRERLAVMRAAGDFARFSMGYHYGFGMREYNQLAPVVNSTADLTAADRVEMRRLLAFLAYDMHSQRRFPYGSGFHHNNPNMTIMAVDGRVKAAGLISDHPMTDTWNAYSLNLAKAFIRRFTRDSGAPFENPHYTVGVTFDQLAAANETFLEHGIGDAFDSDLFERSVRFMMEWLTPPDPRFLGHRLLLPLGNSSYQSVPPALGRRLVEYYRERNPELAGEVQWFTNQTLPDDEHITLVEDRVPELGSGHFEEYGVAFRHGFGTDYETLFHMMAGNCFGHYELETDQMAYTIYAKGQPIHLHFGNGYFPMFVRPWLRNRVSVDRSWEMPERHEPRIEHAAFTGDVEYAHAMKPIDQIQRLTEHPPERGTPDVHFNEDFAPFEDIPLTEWRRQVAFLKDPDPRGPNYFVLRDTFTGTPTRPTELSLWFLSSEMQRDGDLFHFVGQCDVDMDVFVAEPVNAEIETGEYGHVQQPYARRVGFDPNYHPDGKLGETQQLLRLRQPAGQGYLVVLYPRLKENDPAATFTRLDDAAVRVETALATDYIFLNPYAVQFQDERVRFQGMAASVRFFDENTVTVVNLEGAVHIETAGHVISGSGSFEVSLRGDAAPAISPADAEVSVTAAP